MDLVDSIIDSLQTTLLNEPRNDKELSRKEFVIINFNWKIGYFQLIETEGYDLKLC